MVVSLGDRTKCTELNVPFHSHCTSFEALPQMLSQTRDHDAPERCEI